MRHHPVGVHGMLHDMERGPHLVGSHPVQHAQVGRQAVEGVVHRMFLASWELQRSGEVSGSVSGAARSCNTYRRVLLLGLAHIYRQSPNGFYHAIGEIYRSRDQMKVKVSYINEP